MRGIIGNNVCVRAWTSSSERERVSVCREVDRDRTSAWSLAPVLMMNGEARSRGKGRAVRFACFFKIFLVASAVTSWNYGRKAGLRPLVRATNWKLTFLMCKMNVLSSIKVRNATLLFLRLSFKRPADDRSRKVDENAANRAVASSRSRSPLNRS